MLQLKKDHSKYSLPSVVLGAFLILISYTDMVVLIQENSVTYYAMHTFFTGLSIISFGLGVLFTEKKLAVMLTLGAPVIIMILLVVIMFLIKIPLIPHAYFA